MQRMLQSTEYVVNLLFLLRFVLFTACHAVDTPTLSYTLGEGNAHGETSCRYHV